MIEADLQEGVSPVQEAELELTEGMLLTSLSNVLEYS